MSLMFSTARRKGQPEDVKNAERLAEPRSTADVLGVDGLAAVKSVAKTAAKRARAEAMVADIGHDTPLALARIEASQFGTSFIDPVLTPADPRLVAQFGPALCVKHRVLPWRNTAGHVIVLATSVREFMPVRDALRAVFGPVHLAITSPQMMDKAFTRICHKSLMDSAEHRTPEQESCRNWDAGRARVWGLSVLLGLLACLITWPTTVFLILCSWALFTLICNTALKVAATGFHLFPRPPQPVPANPQLAHLPVVTLLVPLFRERDIAGALVGRLSQIDYPQDKLDVCLVLEADDFTTQNALAAAELPDWLRAIRVPLGTLQTKPRALNYALNFARGTIIGVYDAEDAPDPQQIHQVVERFAQRGPEVACLQGRLDFYNSRSNWLARCFTIEYATWFRIMLPGLERMGLAIPLGGTTLFFRRETLETLGGWDAHNVTKDADLGIRLARHGFRTEILDTVTQEEANARAWPWVKQRSRWLKGYAITYSVHMRNPVKLWRDLGSRKFWGVQLLFVGTLSQFVLAPLLWSFWLMLFGLPHPLDAVLSQPVMIALALVFLGSEVLGIIVSALAVTSIGKPELIKWTPTLH
ncbi:MAG: glycosyltransferase, partial [Octadecabacter sp.]|nr:glycosyltransferase [Octadecabacter sp.]